MKKITLSYVVGYLLIGGLGLSLLPSFALELLQSNGDYGDIMPRVVGVMMLGLCGIIALFVYYKDYKYYPYSIYLRTFFVLFFFFLYSRSADPLFVVLNVIILTGLLPSIYTLVREKRTGASAD